MFDLANEAGSRRSLFSNTLVAGTTAFAAACHGLLLPASKRALLYSGPEDKLVTRDLNGFEKTIADWQFPLTKANLTHQLRVIGSSPDGFAIGLVSTPLDLTKTATTLWVIQLKDGSVAGFRLPYWYCRSAWICSHGLLFAAVARSMDYSAERDKNYYIYFSRDTGANPRWRIERGPEGLSRIVDAGARATPQAHERIERSRFAIPAESVDRIWPTGDAGVVVYSERSVIYRHDLFADKREVLGTGRHASVGYGGRLISWLSGEDALLLAEYPTMKVLSSISGSFQGGFVWAPDSSVGLAVRDDGDSLLGHPVTSVILVDLKDFRVRNIGNFRRSVGSKVFHWIDGSNRAGQVLMQIPNMILPVETWRP